MFPLFRARIKAMFDNDVIKLLEINCVIIFAARI